MRMRSKNGWVCIAAGIVASAVLGSPDGAAAELKAKLRSKTQITRHAVDSTNLASVGYDRAGRVLDVEFHSGALYRYFAVPPAVVEELVSATSKGRYFLKHIRGKYEFQRFPLPKP